MYRDLEAIRKVRRGPIEYDVPARDQKQASVVLEEEATGRRQNLRTQAGRYACTGEEDGFDHGIVSAESL